MPLKSENFVVNSLSYGSLSNLVLITANRIYFVMMAKSSSFNWYLAKNLLKWCALRPISSLKRSSSCFLRKITWIIDLRLGKIFLVFSRLIDSRNFW